MALSKTAAKAVKKIEKALDKYDLTDEEIAEILRIIGKTVVKTVEETTEHHRQATIACCGPDADLAHKIAHELELKKQALISNLNALR